MCGLLALRERKGKHAEHTLHTLAPAPAATTPAVVLTLNVLCPSPPVPTISTTKSSAAASISAFSALERKNAAAAVMISGLRSVRVICNAVRKAPIWAGSAADSFASAGKMCSKAETRSDGWKYSGVSTSLWRRGLNVTEDLAAAIFGP